MFSNKWREFISYYPASLPEWEYMHAVSVLEWAIEDVQTKVQSITKRTSGVGVQWSNSLVHEIVV